MTRIRHFGHTHESVADVRACTQTRPGPTVQTTTPPNRAARVLALSQSAPADLERRARYTASSAERRILIDALALAETRVADTNRREQERERFWDLQMQEREADEDRAVAAYKHRRDTASTSPRSR